jgi:hypothetical protein
MVLPEVAEILNIDTETQELTLSFDGRIVAYD